MPSFFREGFGIFLEDGFTYPCYWFAPATSSLQTKDMLLFPLIDQFVQFSFVSLILTNEKEIFNRRTTPVLFVCDIVIL
ncbi:MAG: hypothetical protein C6W57_01855 [Caldibacillus debilis]|nr:MAG: hypothetical protein C6W57_01855 [Caldibacillus debilis]